MINVRERERVAIQQGIDSGLLKPEVLVQTETEKALDIIKNELESLDDCKSELGEMKATLLVNFGPMGREKKIITDRSAYGLSMLMDVLNYYDKELKKLTR